MHILHGVPQGTVLGPILFLIYINSLCSLPVTGSIYSYADDTSIVVSSSTWEDTKITAENCLLQIQNHLDDNLLSLNLQKTHYICFSPTKRGSPPPSFCLQYHNSSCDKNPCDCPKMDQIVSTKYLGVQIDKFLKWTEHIDIISRKIRHSSYIFYRIRNICSRHFMRTVYM